MTVSPPGYWLLDRMIFLTNKILRIINEKGIEIITNLLKDNNTFTGINTFTGGINVDSINSINGNTTFNSEIIVNSNITANNGSFIGDNLVINIIEKNTDEGDSFQNSIIFQNSIDMSNQDNSNINSLTSQTLYTDNIETVRSPNVVFSNSIDMNYNNINNVDTIFSNTLNINTISLEDSSSPYITFQDDIRLNKGINIIGDLVVNGSTITVNSQTLTINDRFITLNANLSGSGLSHTDPAGIIVDTHDSNDKQNRGYLLWTLSDPTNQELNRTWDLSGDNLRGNVLKATTLRGNILDSYYSSNISVIKNINMNNNDISNINTLTARELNIDIIKRNTSANISVMNTIDMNNNYIINANIAALNHSQINVEHGLINSRNLTLGGFNADQTNEVTFRAWHGLNPLENTTVVLYPNDTLYLPENNGVPFGSKHTQSIIGIGGLSKDQENYQQLLNSQCYLIPPSMVLNESDCSYLANSVF